MLDAASLFTCARIGIESKWNEKEAVFPTLSPGLLEERASFVTLTIDGALRGCIGTLLARYPLWEDIKRNAYNAAFVDFRFPPLTEEEYKKIAIEISILTPPELLAFSSESELREKITPYRDGILLKCNGRRATFLPQVWEKLPDFDTFFSHLFHKAGLGFVPDFTNATIERYEVEKYHE